MRQKWEEHFPIFLCANLAQLTRYLQTDVKIACSHKGVNSSGCHLNGVNCRWRFSSRRHYIWYRGASGSRGFKYLIRHWRSGIYHERNREAKNNVMLQHHGSSAYSILMFDVTKLNKRRLSQPSLFYYNHMCCKAWSILYCGINDSGARAFMHRSSRVMLFQDTYFHSLG